MQDYYTVRAASGDYSNYWGTATDPDGNVRDRVSYAERMQYLADNRELIQFAKSLLPDAVLDVGAGRGWMLQQFTCSWKVAIERADELEHVMPYVDEAFTEFSWVESSRFDLVICHHVIEHLIDPIYAIGHMHRVLKKGGWLMMSTPDFGSPCAKRFGDKFRLLHDPTHISLFTLESMSRMLRDYGFTIRETLFPFPERYATAENFARWNDTSKVSPPWPGNVVTMFCTRD